MAEKIDLELKNKVCAHCEQAVANQDLCFCPFCDKPLQSAVIPDLLEPCLACRKNISRIAEFCVHCGRPMQPNFSKKIYTLLLWLVGLSIAASIGLGIWFGYKWNQQINEYKKIERRLRY